MKKALFYFTFICLTLSFASCTHNLTREQAEQILKQQDFSQYRQTDYIRKSFVLSDMYLGAGAGGIRQMHTLPAITASKVDQAVAKGLITISDVVHPEYDAWGSPTLKTGEQTIRYFNLTAEGKKYFAGDDGNDNKVILFDRGFGNLTGMRQDNEKTVSVDYTLVVVNATPFAAIFAANLTQVQPMHATFVKHDDGWKLQ